MPGITNGAFELYGPWGTFLFSDPEKGDHWALLPVVALTEGVHEKDLLVSVDVTMAEKPDRFLGNAV